MAATESCAACGCTIAGRKTGAGDAVAFSGKVYCAECAAMILPPEEIAKLSQPGPVTKMKFAKAAVMSDDDAIGETEIEEPTKPAVAAKPAPVTAAPAVAKSSLRSAPAQATAPAKTTASARVSPPQKSSSASGRNGSKPVTEAPPVAPSRRASAITGVKGKKPTSSTGVKAEREERPGREAARGKKKAANSNGLYIGIGVGVLLLVGGGIFAFSGGKTKKATAAKAVVETDDDKTSSTEYARRAEKALENKDKKLAIKMYSNAASKAEKEGNSDQGRIYGNKITDIMKSSKITD